MTFGPDGALLGVFRKVNRRSGIMDSICALFFSGVQVHLFDIDIPGKQRFKESDVLSPGNKLLSFDTSNVLYNM